MDSKHPQLQNDLVFTELSDRIYNLSSPPVGFQEYLVVGNERALLIDTGMGVCPLRATVEKITPLPLTVVNTHGHPDHAGGNGEFSPALMCPDDFEVYECMASLEFRKRDLEHMPGGANLIEKLLPLGPAPIAAANGQIIELGGRRVRLVFTPGHTRGSLCVFDENTGTLITGDNVQARETALREWNSASIEEFHESLLHMQALNPSMLMGGHKPNINEPQLINRLLRCTEAILAGAKGEERPSRGGGTALCYELDGVSLSYTESNIFRCK